MSEIKEGDRLEIRVTKEFLGDWAGLEPDMPAADELMLWVRASRCASCGDMISNGIGALDLEYITEDGEIVGKHYCEACMREGK